MKWLLRTPVKSVWIKPPSQRIISPLYLRGFSGKRNIEHLIVFSCLVHLLEKLLQLFFRVSGSLGFHLWRVSCGSRLGCRTLAGLSSLLHLTGSECMGP